MILTLILRTAFPLSWFQNQTVIKWSNGLNQNKHAWNILFYKAIRVQILDLGLELVELYKQLDLIIVKPFDWIFFIRMVSRSHEFFLLKISHIEKIVFSGLEEPIEERDAYSSKYTQKVLHLNELRRETLFRFYERTYEPDFQNQFVLVAGELLDLERIESIRNLADLTPLADKDELDSNLL